MLRRPSEDVSSRRILIRDKSKENNKSGNNSFNVSMNSFSNPPQSLNNNQLKSSEKPGRYESKVRAALEKIVDQSIKAINQSSIDDQSFYSVLHDSNRLNFPHEKDVPSRDMSFTTDFDALPVKPVIRKKSQNAKKRAQTPHMYYRGTFDVTTATRPSLTNLPSITNVDKSYQPSQPSTQNDLDTMAKEYVHVVDHGDYDQPPQNPSILNSRVQTPVSQEENTIDFKKIIPQKSHKMNGRAGTPLKAYTGSFYNQQPQPRSRSNSASKKGALDSSILGGNFDEKFSVRGSRNIHEKPTKVFLLDYNMDI